MEFDFESEVKEVKFFTPPFNMKSYWVISDTHFFHKNIIKYCGRPENHNELMMENWKYHVKESDVIVHLGDIAFSKRELFEELADSRFLTGNKYLIKGNHDKQKDHFYQNCGFEIIEPFYQKFQNHHVWFTHYPVPALHGGKQLNVHGHIHEKNKADKRYINVSVEQTRYSPIKIDEYIAKQIIERGL